MAQEPETNQSEAEARRQDQDEIVIDALARGLSYGRAGELAGVSPRTVRRRMADEAFAREVRTRRTERVSAVTGQLVTASEEAVGVLMQCLGAEKDGVRIRAATLLLQHSERYRAQSDLQADVAEIRRMLSDGSDNATESDEPDPS